MSLSKCLLAAVFVSATWMALPSSLAAEAAKPATTKPVGGGSLETRAEVAFERGEWPLALPMLQQVADQLKSTNPDRYNTLQDQIRICNRQMPKAQADQAI